MQIPRSAPARKYALGACPRPIASRDLPPDDARADDAVEPWEFPIEIGVASLEQRCLPAGADAAARRLAVLGVERIDDVHAAGDAPERGERLGAVCVPPAVPQGYRASPRLRIARTRRA